MGLDQQNRAIVGLSADNGETWQVNLLLDSQHNNFNGGILRVIWDDIKQQYIAVGLEFNSQLHTIEVILTSADGNSWQKHYTKQSRAMGMLNDIAKYKDRYIAVGVYGDNTTAHADIQISADGINWQQQIKGIETLPAKLSAIATKNGKVVIMGKDYSVNPGKIISLVSLDGMEWHSYDTGVTQNAICVVSINWELANIVVVGLKDLPDSVAGYSQYTAQVLTSSDGVNWAALF